MPVRLIPNDGPHDKSVTLAEGEIRTTISQLVHGDLLIRQVHPDGRTVSISTGSDSGLSFFAVLVKFLATQGHARPRIAGEKNSLRNRAYVDEMAAGEARTAQIRQFPYRFHDEKSDSMAVAHIMPSGSLEIEAGGKRMIITPALGHALTENIPKVIPISTAYRLLTAKIWRSAGRPRTIRTKPSAEYRAGQPQKKINLRPGARRRKKS